MKPSPRKPKQYELEQSPLYKLSSKRKLAELLQVDLVTLGVTELAKLTSNYRIFVHCETGRFITEPVGTLIPVHKRLLSLFSRVVPRDYIHSATKKRSYKTNAEKHIGNQNILKIDIKKFFPSVRFCYVHNFFANTLKCSPDLATILAKLCTVRTKKHGVHLPTGSCISPILSFLANRDLFDRIEKLCIEADCTFTLYVDDVTISGPNATRALLTRIAMEIHKNGYGYHKIKTYHAVPAMVTGLIVTEGRLILPHARCQKIRQYAEALECSVGGQIREKLLASLVGRLSEAEQIDAKYRTARQDVLKRYAVDWGRVMALRIASAKHRARKTASVNKPSTTLLDQQGDTVRSITASS
ncbi:reverse transcriptase (RNA-dependent DNA polymerase) [Janthinobacterium sp. 67]|uniref:reverse transcriptase family protein n=1 Tax=Janthinobacterium sp. 67 TaxID=2035207 RepID=UPI000C24C54E|nr:reverse transcriptase family protein [Janthinobacterium sp. 67]PJJ20741.1 reverse transcriptase (RNA-dependent DNA polymerase) [Janthinobacterium sp. 67]